MIYAPDERAFMELFSHSLCTPRIKLDTLYLHPVTVKLRESTWTQGLCSRSLVEVRMQLNIWKPVCGSELRKLGVQDALYLPPHWISVVKYVIHVRNQETVITYKSRWRDLRRSDSLVTPYKSALLNPELDKLKPPVFCGHELTLQWAREA